MSFVGVSLLLLVTFFSHNPTYGVIFPVFFAGLISAALWEYYQIATALGYQPLFKVGIIGTIFYCIAVFLSTQSKEATYFPAMVLWTILLISFLCHFFKGTKPLVNLAITLFGIGYLTIPLACLIDINYFSGTNVTDGRWAFIYILIVTKMTDTSAFFIGKRFGQHQMTRTISPKKTWEGAIGGLLGALIASYALFFIFQFFFDNVPFTLTFPQSLWFPLLIGVIAEIGDLAESLLKRDGGIKDSSSLPGLGGILDIFDSVVFTAPLMYLFLYRLEGV